MVFIKCDDREKPEVLKILKDIGVSVIKCRMNEGDYIWRDKICVERKSIDDFCGSIMDGRLSSQIEKMKSKYSNVIILISGKISERTSEIHENCILGKMASIIVKHKVNIIQIDNDKQLAYIMKRIFERYEEDEKNEK